MSSGSTPGEPGLPDDAVRLVEMPMDTKGLKTPREITEALNPSIKRRLLTILSFPLLMLAAVPFWWWATSITRLPLPVDRIAALEASSPPVSRSSIHITADPGVFPRPVPYNEILASLAHDVHDGVDSTLQQEQPVVQREWKLTPNLAHEEKADLKVHIQLCDEAKLSFPLEPYVQPPETGLMSSGIEGGALVIPINPDQVQDQALQDQYKTALISSLLSLVPPRPPEIPLRAIKYQPNVTLSFVLLNEDAAEGGYVRCWDIEEALRDHFDPHLAPLRDIFNFSIESQILYHAPLTFEPQYGNLHRSSSDQGRIDAALEQASGGDETAEEVAKELIDEIKDEEERGWGIDEEMMKVFVNSERWSLDSGSTNNPVLRFLLFIPSIHHRPMHLAVPDSADAFLLPQYGSVVLLNPPSYSSETRYHLNVDTLTPSFHLFTQHLYSLLSLPALTLSSNIHRPPSVIHHTTSSDLIQPISPWQVHQVMRQRAKENSEEARKTLAGIVRLVKKIKEMKVGPGVRDMVLGAVQALEKMDQTTDVREQFLLSRDAVGLANQAFFDPSMMGLLYFPDEHKFAVYTPLFAPVAVPILVALLKELLAWGRRRKARKGTSKSHGGKDDVGLQVVIGRVALGGEEKENGSKEDQMQDRTGGEGVMSAGELGAMGVMKGVDITTPEEGAAPPQVISEVDPPQTASSTIRARRKGDIAT